MAEFQDGQDVTYVAAADLRTKQFRAVRISDDNKIDVGSAAAGQSRAIGILQSKPNTGEHGSVRIYGESKYQAGAAVAQNDELGLGSDGFLTAITVASGTTRHVLGVAKYDVVSGAVGAMTIQPTWRGAFV